MAGSGPTGEGQTANIAASSTGDDHSQPAEFQGGDHADAARVSGEVTGPLPGHDAGAGEAAHFEAMADSLASDTLMTNAGDDLGDLHAALASLSSDTFAYLDAALDHLTSSPELFDVPAIDFSDDPGDFTAS